MTQGMTTIEISRSDKTKLDKFRRYPKEPYRLVIHRLLEVVEDTEPLTDEEIAEIRESLEEIERGEYVTHEELKRDLGLE
ncbi:hypothetical protein RJ53_07205 [Methanocalculus chunghsingensis]|uniref:Uncharacterized protein n=1 Tax=Methanocalculus chunghsingensis TaxID=156457 RepID=A0A8J7WAG6_9EURY|nr:hypothetical protein [Methanocalculus chunghsingensis]MBR1369290.1 hypothetical protein [Methanocalculus chunghsingensis]